MPTYEYACPKCGIVEAFQSMREDALTTCPKCKKRKVTRVISGGAGVIFTGDGFWETDYNRSADYRTKAKDGAAPAKDVPPEPTTKPEPKPEAKPDAKPAAKSDTKSDTKTEAKPATTKPAPAGDGGDRRSGPGKPPPPVSQ